MGLIQDGSDMFHGTSQEDAEAADLREIIAQNRARRSSISSATDARRYVAAQLADDYFDPIDAELGFDIDSIVADLRAELYGGLCVDLIDAPSFWRICSRHVV
jgi:hypothetical protein